MEGGRFDETAILLRCLSRLSSKTDEDERRDSQRADSSVSLEAGEGGTGWGKGCHAVLAAVQELVRNRTGGATLALIL